MKLSIDRGSYVKSIGFYIKDGKRVQKRFYLGSDESAAIVLAAKLKTSWRESANTSEVPGMGQVWRDDFKVELADETPEQTLERISEPGQVDELPDGPEYAATTTLAAALAWFYNSKEKRLKMRNIASIKMPSIKTVKANLSACLAPFPQFKFLADFNADNCQTIYEYWLSTDHANRPGGKTETVGERTATNYLETLKSFLRNAGMNSAFDYDFPSEVAAWKFSKKKGEVITPTLDELSIIYKAASARMKCFMLIALNAGQIANDIGRMSHEDITIDNGHSVIRKVRLKTAQKVTYKGSWQLWKETVEAIKANKADGEFLFLNKDGRPLYDNDKENSKIDAIGDEFKDLTDSLLKEGKRLRVKESGNALVTFKTIRAFGASWITDKAKSEYFAKLYLCQQIGSGATQNYIDIQYAPLQPMLKDLRKALTFI